MPARNRGTNEAQFAENRERVVKALKRQVDPIETMRLAENLGMSRHTMLRHLNALKDEGVAFRSVTGWSVDAGRPARSA